MDLKEFLLEGGGINHPYKKLLTEYVGDAKLYIFAGYWGKPKIIFETPYERSEWPVDEIDQALKHYDSVVFNPINIMYKMNEAVREVVMTGQQVDLDEQKDFDKVNAIRSAKVMKAIKDKQREHGTDS